MAWEYLLETNMDFRIAAALPYIYKHQDTNDVLVDLDCGHSPLLELGITGKYIGNDTLSERLLMAAVNENVTILDSTDAEMVDYLKHKQVDILCCFGFADRALTGEPLESDTLSQSIREIITNNSPSLVVIECIEEFIPGVQKIVDFASKYKLVQRLHMADALATDSRITRRVLFILEKTL